MSRIGVFLLGMMLAVTALAQQPETSRVTGQIVTGPNQQEAASILDLSDVIREALAKNPGVQSALHIVNAQQHKIPQAKSLADPMVSVGWNGNLAPFSVQEGDPSSYRGIGVSQQIPYPGKLRTPAARSLARTLTLRNGIMRQFAAVSWPK